MARVTIADLPKDLEISRDEMKALRGGAVECFLKIDGVRGESTGCRPVEEVIFRTGGGEGDGIIDIPH